MDEENIAVKVLNAVQGIKNGETKEFNSLNAVLTSPTMDDATLCHYIRALKNSIRYMNKDHETLIGVILNIDWSTLDQSTIELFIEFIADLISAKTYYLKVCVRCLVKQFVARSEMSDEELLNVKKKFDSIHVALRTIVNLAPLASKYIADNVTKCFPYIGKCLFVLETYMVNILQISTYVMETRFHILSLCIDKMMSIDVRIPKKQFEQSNDENELQFDDLLPKEEIQEDIHISKLDQLMVILFTYINSLCHVAGELDQMQAELLFKELLLIYDGVILKTQQSLHVQFVIFYTASFHQKFAESFINCCWKILQDPNIACIIRQASAGYLSSFLARAKYVDVVVIKSQLQKLSAWIHRYIDFQDGNNIMADFDKHGPFYSTCQALFYVFIYHHKHLLDSHKNIEFIKSLSLIRIVTSKLNPLKFCLNTVVNMFARITRMYEIVFCYSIMERNNRNILCELTFTANNITMPSNRMEMFFPFDPYMLPKSKEFIKPLYFEWTGSVDDDSDDSDEEVDTSDILSDLHVDKHDSFDMMCVSPGFSLAHHEH